MVGVASDVIEERRAEWRESETAEEVKKRESGLI